MSTYYSATGEDDALTGTSGVTGGGAYISLHSASPGTTGANEISGGSPAYARVQTTWGSASGGSAAGSQVVINVPGGTTIEFFGIWSALSSGTYIGGGALSANETYAAQGTYAITVTQTAAG